MRQKLPNSQVADEGFLKCIAAKVSHCWLRPRYKALPRCLFCSARARSLYLSDLHLQVMRSGCPTVAHRRQGHRWQRPGHVR